MIIKQELVSQIRDHFGLNIYETKVWLALLGKGIASAGEIAEISGVPRSRTYDRVNINKTVKGGELILDVFHMGVGLSLLRIPFGLRTRVLASKFIFTKDRIKYSFISPKEKFYEQIKLVDAFPNFFFITNVLVFHFNGSIFSVYGNVVNKNSLVQALKFLKSKGCPISKKAEEIISQ